MQRKALDAQAIGLMLVLCMIWGLQQVVMKWAAIDISTMLQVALRSGLSALLVLLLILKQSNLLPLLTKNYLKAGLIVGVLFALEFFCLAQALRFTTASHAVVLLYTAPIFVALVLHFKIAAERLAGLQWLGIGCAFLGILLTFLGKASLTETASQTMLIGDLWALVAGILWAATTLGVRLSALAEAPATITLFYQLFIGCLILLPITFMLGQQHLQWSEISISALLFHSVIVSFLSYLAWFWLLKKYLASRLGVFSFLTPLFGLLFGVVLLKEQLELNFIFGTLLVMLGVVTVSAYPWLMIQLKNRAESN